MHFTDIDNLSEFHVYSLSWRFTDNSEDPWTARLNAFKDKDAMAIEAACSVMPLAVSTLNWNKGKFALVSAIPSNEEILPETSGLFHLGGEIASSMGWEWEPYVLKKGVHRTLHGIPNASERDAEIANKYFAIDTINAEYICILDDLVTRGATIAEISRAIKEVNSTALIFGIVLGKTERQRYAKKNGHDIDNNHIPIEYAELWDNIWKSK